MRDWDEEENYNFPAQLQHSRKKTSMMTADHNDNRNSVYRIQRMFACCPTNIATYIAMNMDSIGKIVNHALIATLLFNILLFFASWNVSFLPNLGFTTVLVAFLLCSQTVTVWLILNNNRFSALSFLAPTEFMVGVALGITVGGAILAFVISNTFRHVAECDPHHHGGSTSTSTTPMTPRSIDPVFEYICSTKRRSMNSIWFWSGLVFWLNFCTSLLIAIGRPQLTQEDGGGYESIGAGPSMDDYEDHFRNRAAMAGTFPGGIPVPTYLVGDYASVPDIQYASASASAAAAVHPVSPESNNISSSNAKANTALISNV